MGQTGLIIGQLIMIIGGTACFLIYGGFYTPKFDTEEQKKRHQALLAKRGNMLKFAGLAIAIYGAYQLFVSL